MAAPRHHVRVSPALLVLGVVLVVLGVGLLAMPIVPAIGIIFAGVAVVAWADDFARIGWWTLGVMLVLTVIGSLADNVATLFGARKAGASGWGVAGAAIGMLVGFPFGLPGIIAGPALGAFAASSSAIPTCAGPGWPGSAASSASCWASWRGPSSAC